ncbi:MAG: hypothetical protein ABI769_11040 [Pseudomonadota bacterium]
MSIRQFHRSTSIVFTLTVIANFVVMSQGTPPAWVTYSPLLPLGLLLLTGLYLFVLPYLTRKHGPASGRLRDDSSQRRARAVVSSQTRGES